MRSGGSSKQLTLIIVLLVVLILLMGTLLCLTLFKGKEPDGEESLSQMENTPVVEEVSSYPESSSSESEEVSESSREEISQSSTETQSIEEPSEPSKPSKPSKPSYPQLYEISHKVFGDEGASYEAKEIIRNGYITKGNIALRNRTFLENLYITPGAEDDPIVLQNIVVKGKIVINGAGKVTLHDVKAPVVQIETKNKENALIVSGVSTIDNLEVKSSVSIDEENVNKSFPGIKNIIIEDNPNYLWLDVDLYDVKADLVYAGGIANIYVDKNSAVDTVNAVKMCHLDGYGEVNKLNVYADGVTYVSKPGKIAVKSNSDEPCYSKEKIDGRIK